ncbi:MAG: hypothetical protein NTW09_03845, partial [Candidatus Omnitrophica bacterium]|nr:hypothetical protein [Candidatus Omnitrophota bacterium]
VVNLLNKNANLFNVKGGKGSEAWNDAVRRIGKAVAGYNRQSHPTVPQKPTKPTPPPATNMSRPADKETAGEDKFKGIDFKRAKGVVPFHADKIRRELASFLDYINDLPAGSSLTMEELDPRFAFLLSRDEARARRERHVWHELANEALLNNGWSYIRHSNNYIKRKPGQTDDELRLELILGFLRMNHPDEVRLGDLIRDFNITDSNVHIVPDILREEKYLYAQGTGDLYRRMANAEENAVMNNLAESAAKEIDHKADGAIYTLMLPSSQFYKNDEFDTDNIYGSRFHREMMDGRTLEELTRKILESAKGKEGKCIALIPKHMVNPDSESDKSLLQSLTDVNIRFTLADLVTAGLATDKTERAQFRADTYAIMLLKRHIDKGMEGTSAYRLLSYYLRTHFGFTEAVAVDDYINAVVNGEIARLIKGYLVYEPCVRRDAREEYHKISCSLIFA